MPKKNGRTLAGFVAFLAMVLGLVVAQATPASAAEVPQCTAVTSVLSDSMEFATAQVCATSDGTAVLTATFTGSALYSNQFASSVDGGDEQVAVAYPTFTFTTTGLAAGLHEVQLSAYQASEDFVEVYSGSVVVTFTVPMPPAPPRPTMTVTSPEKWVVVVTFSGDVPPDVVSFVTNPRRVRLVSTVQVGQTVTSYFSPVQKPNQAPDKKPSWRKVGIDAALGDFRFRQEWKFRW